MFGMGMQELVIVLIPPIGNCHDLSIDFPLKAPYGVAMTKNRR